MADMAYYPQIPAVVEATGRPAPRNALFEVFELADTSFSFPLPLLTVALTNGAPLLTTEQGIVPAVYVVSPNFSHAFKSGDWVWRRDSFDGAERQMKESRDAAVAAAAAAAASAKAAQAAAAGGGGGSGAFMPDPANPGFYLLETTSGSSLTPDPDYPGLYLMEV